MKQFSYIQHLTSSDTNMNETGRFTGSDTDHNSNFVEANVMTENNSSKESHDRKHHKKGAHKYKELQKCTHER